MSLVEIDRRLDLVSAAYQQTAVEAAVLRSGASSTIRQFQMARKQMTQDCDLAWQSVLDARRKLEELRSRTCK